MLTELNSFFDAYRNSFVEGPAAIATFYSEPCVTARAGAVRVNASRVDTAALFAEIDRQYRGRGFTHANHILQDWRSLGSNSAIVTLRWSYKGSRDETIWEATFSYNLLRRDDIWKILLQTLHDE